MDPVNIPNSSVFKGGNCIAIKTPKHVYDNTVKFYSDVLRLPRIEKHKPGYAFEFGSNTLFIDCVEHLSQSEVWLQVIVSNVEAAKFQCAANGITRCDHIENLPDGYDGFWILSPSATVHLVSGPNEQ
jgi:hypothetical protein